ncbi:hypothetical protein LguiA_004979 [Lonicera macranthoides]
MAPYVAKPSHTLSSTLSLKYPGGGRNHQPLMGSKWKPFVAPTELSLPFFFN